MAPGLRVGENALDSRRSPASMERGAAARSAATRAAAAPDALI